MAKSFLEAQLKAVNEELAKIPDRMREVDRVQSDLLSRSFGVTSAGDVGGPGGGPSNPPGPGGGGVSVVSNPRGDTTQFGSRGTDGGGAPGALSESEDFVKRLMAAARWAQINPPYQALHWKPKSLQENLIAAWEAAGAPGVDGGSMRGASGSGGGARSGGGSTQRGGPNWIDNGAGRNNDLAGYQDAMRDSYVNAANGMQAALAKTTTAGDKVVAGAIAGVAKAVDKLASKIDNNGGLGFRMKGL